MDQKCVLCCILASKHPVEKNAERPNKYKEYLSELNCKDIERPMAVPDINRFEKMNNLTTNVYGCSEDGKEICPRRISNRRDNKSIYLLMLDNEMDDVLIRDLNRLLRRPRKSNNTKIYCSYCCYRWDKRSLKPVQMVEHMER